MKIPGGSVTTPEGFMACGVSCGLKKDSGKDLALVYCTVPASAAGVFTKNLVKGHSLIRTKHLIGKIKVRGLIINSGNANACLGLRGDTDAQALADAFAGELTVDPDCILTASTGVIGKPLPMHLLIPGIQSATKMLDRNPSSGHDAAIAIMTTDTVSKECCVQFQIDEFPVHIAAMAKGSGMIHPNMATMISVITTDCNISDELLDYALKQVNERTFNRISIDGDTSVCDMVVIMSSCLSLHPMIVDRSDTAYHYFENALYEVCHDLSRKLALDGEGATKLLTIEVIRANTHRDAYLIASAVAKSPLVKTAMFGEDANWGRIITAAGYSGADFNPSDCSIFFNGFPVCSAGIALPFDEAKAKSILTNKEITITIDLTCGDCSDSYLTCDYSYDYIKINGSYRS